MAHATAGDRAPAELTALFRRMEVPLEVVATKEKGKHVRATAPIAAGTVLFEEAPLVWWPFDVLRCDSDGGEPSSYCSGCARIVAQGVRCGRCDRAVYCAASCRDAAAAAHQVLCGLEEQLHAFHDKQTEAIRAIRRKSSANADATGDEAAVEANTGQLLPITVEAVARCIAVIVARFRRALVQTLGSSNGSSGSGNGASVDEFPPMSAVAALDAATVKAIFDAAALPFNRLVEPPPMAEFAEEGLDIAVWVSALQATLRPRVAALTGNLPAVVEALLSDVTLHTLIGQISLNAQAVNRALPLSGDKKPTCSSDAPVPTITVTVAAGLYTLQSCFNHSCAPNCEILCGTDAAAAAAAAAAAEADAERGETASSSAPAAAAVAAAAAAAAAAGAAAEEGAEGEGAEGGEEAASPVDIALRTSKNVAAGEEICITYIPEIYLELESLQQRRSRLRPYLFTCMCSKCESEVSAVST